MPSEILFFIFRFAVLVVVSILFIIASRILFNNIVYENYCKDYRKLNKRRVATKVLFFIGILIGVFAIIELCFNNPNEWLGAKISGYVFIWSALTYLSITYGERELWYKDRLKLSLFSKPIGILASISTVPIVGFLVCGGIMYSAQPVVHVEREIVSSTKLVAVNDGYQLEGKITNKLFKTTFAISNNGVYRYYYRDKNGGIKQSYVDADNTTIYFTKGSEAPYLDCLISYEYKVHFRNKEAYEVKNNEKIWYELYVPEGSIAEAYEFDLN